jgi:hypothetical protein
MVYPSFVFKGLKNHEKSQFGSVASWLFSSGRVGVGYSIKKEPTDIVLCGITKTAFYTFPI